MILTKENVAAQAFAEHIEGLNMPQCITSKIGRLVGYMEACIVLFGTSQNIGRNVASAETYLPYCHPLVVGLTSSGYLTPMTV